MPFFRRSSPRPSPKGSFRGLRRLVSRLLLLILALLFLDLGRFFIWPPVAPLATENPQSSSFMEYRQQEWRQAGKKNTLAYTWVPWHRISPNLKLAVTIAEDDKFWEHEGFDLEGMEEALRKNVAQKRWSAGGSSITQQVAKNLWFTPQKSLYRKAKEAIMTWRLEQHLFKERILELYLNIAEWGDGIFGAEEASRRYFGIPAAKLSPMQAAILASMLPNPLKRRPDSPVVLKKAAIIYKRMERRR